ncbi:MAG: TIM barrel protein [Planctomycetota bacterium]|jgi:sugar phosphate isomerase/epimerase
MNYKDYLKLGVNHHMLYADYVSQPLEHQRTLMEILGDERFEVLDMWIPQDEPYRTDEIKAVSNCGKEIYYNVGPRPGKEDAHPASLDPAEKQYAIDFYKSELDRAIECKAIKVVTNSGPNNPEKRAEAIDSLVDFYIEICNYAPDMLIMIEPTDWDMSKYMLIGSSKEATEVCKKVQQAGCRNIASMVDICHVPLMHETIEQAMRDTGEYLSHIHMGNCILKDKNHKLFGDKHPPLYVEGGEYNIDDHASLFKVGLDIGYFGTKTRGSATIEARPIEGKKPAECLDLYYDYFCNAWSMAVET